ncbi:MAG: methyltransferase [bacterium]
MNSPLIITLISIFLTIHIESLFLILQKRGQLLTKWFGKYAFKIHAAITLSLWSITFILIFFLQLHSHPQFHDHLFLKYTGSIATVAGLILAVWGFSLLGLKRALCLNFYEKNVPQVKKSLYKYIKNPLDIGLWTALLGFALWTGSLFNLIIAGEFILVMLPHIRLENKPLG